LIRTSVDEVGGGVGGGDGEEEVSVGRCAAATAMPQRRRGMLAWRYIVVDSWE
jgi:hypothetical protein